MSRDLRRYARDPVAFIDAMIPRNEKGQPWRLAPYQRRVLTLAFRWEATGRLLMRLLLWGEPKKSGKTLLASALTLWWGFVTPDTEVILAANDLEQSVSRVFRTCVALCRRNPTTLLPSVKLLASEILVSNGTRITAIASDYKGAAGSRHSLYVIDEPWGFTQESATRLVEELTPPPTEPNAWGLMTTTAGFSGESVMLETLYHRGLTGEHLDPELEVYRADDLLMFWSHTARQPWQTEAYYAEQRRSLRPNTYLRLHENRWVSAESRAFGAEAIDACTEPAWGLLDPGEREPEVFVGADIGTRSDHMALVAVARDADLVVLVNHKVWKPAPGSPVDIETTLEAALRTWHQDYRVTRILIDPYQAYRSLATLTAAHLPVEEPPTCDGRAARPPSRVSRPPG